MKGIPVIGFLLALRGFFFPAVAQTPAARIYHSMVETEDGRIIVVAGNSKHGWSMDLYDVWAYELESNEWTEIGQVEAGEVFGAYGAAYDRQAKRVIFLNREGETWALDPTDGTWEHRDPPEGPSSRCGQGMAYDAGSDRVVLFGGFGCTSVSDPVFDDTWSYDYESDTWTRHEPEAAPPARMYHAMAYHEGADRVIVWGGRVEDSKVWAFDLEGETWTAVEAAGGPEGIRSYHTMAYMPASESVIVFGGLNLDTWSSASGTMLNETWSLDLIGREWTRLETVNTPPVRSHHAMATHSPTASLVVFGGELEEAYSDLICDEVWMFEPATLRWSRRSR